MPDRFCSLDTAKLSATPRRSPRLLRVENPQEEQPTEFRKSPRVSRQERGDQKSPKSRSDSAKRVSKCCSENIPKQPGKISKKSGSKKSLVLENGIGGISNLRRSSRVSEQRKQSGSRNKVAESSRDSGEGTKNRGNSANRKGQLRINKCCSENVPKQPGKTSKKYGSKKPLVLGIGVVGLSNLRRSSRVCEQRKQNCSREKVAKSSGDSGDGTRNRGNSANRKGRLRIVKAENRVASKRVKKENPRNELVRSKAVVNEEREESEKERSRIVEAVSRKRKRVECEERSGWTNEQELALQRAYLTAKPTPQFWKKVSRLVPGKSAQDCFDKLNSEYATPPQQRRRVSRARRENPSPVPPSQISASKVLKPTEPSLRNPRRNKQRTRAAHKNARHLLQEQYDRGRAREADLFSVLEPDLDFSRQPFPVLSTPKQPMKQNRRNLGERSSSSSSVQKKSLSRFSAPRDGALTSPPVLKTLKNKVLHEKYIDRLHIRDAQRKTASELLARKCALKTDGRDENRNQNLDAVLAAKNALISDARDAITRLQQVHSSDLEYDIFRGDGDESEIEM